MAAEPEGTTTVSLNVLGSLELVREPDGVLKTPRGARVRHVLALFAVKDQYGRQELVDILWPGAYLDDERPGEAKLVSGRLHRVLSDARKALKLDRRAEVLTPDLEIVYRTRGKKVEITSDLEEFHKLARSTDAEDWRAALTLVRGPVAQYVPTKNMRKDWIDRERETQRREIKEVLARLDPEATSETLERQCQEVLDGQYIGSHAAPVPDNTESVGRSPEPTEIATSTTVAEPSEPTRLSIPDGTALTSRRISRVTEKRLIVGVLALAVVAALAVGRAPWPAAHSASIPPPGSIVNALTGRPSLHIPTRFLPDKANGPEITIGTLFWACDISAGQSCHYPPHTGSIVAHRGDLIDFWVRLYNPLPTPIPYVKLAMFWAYGKAGHSWEIDTQMEILWPNSHNEGTGPIVEPIQIRLPSSGFYQLAYIPKSTVLTAPDTHFHHTLPDGIMHRELSAYRDFGGIMSLDMPGGIGLADVGPPPSCLQCISESARFISFQVRVV